MARKFNSENSQYLEYYDSGWAPMREQPTITMSCWFKTNNLLDSKNTLVSYSSPNTNIYMSLSLDGAASGDPLEAQYAGSVFSYRRPSNPHTAHNDDSYSSGVWNHAAMRGDIPYLNGSGNYHYLVNESGYAGGLTSMDTIGVGARMCFGPQYPASGINIAEVAFWNVVLSAEEVRQLSLGFSPLFIRKNNLVFYSPIHGKDLPETEYVNHLHLRPSLSNPTDCNDHPPIIYPAPKPYIDYAIANNKIVLDGRGIPSQEGFGTPSFARSGSSNYLTINFGFPHAVSLATDGLPVTHNLDNITDSYANVFCAAKTVVAHELGYWRHRSLSNVVVPYVIGLQYLNVSGVPDGNNVVSGVFIPQFNTNNDREFHWVSVAGTGYQINKGDLIATVLKPVSPPSGNLEVGAGVYYGLFQGNTVFPRVVADRNINLDAWHAGAVKDTNQNIVIGNAGSRIFESFITTSGNRQAMKFNIPSTVMKYFRVAGIQCLMNREGVNSRTVRFGLWQGNTLITKKDISSNAIIQGNLSNQTELVKVYFEACPVLNTDQDYYIGIERNNINIALHGTTFGESEDIIRPNTGWQYSTCVSGVWADSGTVWPHVKIIFGDIAG